MVRVILLTGGAAAVAASFIVARSFIPAQPAVPTDASSFRLIGEGGMHSVFGYNGTDPKWRGKVLRLRRRDAVELKHEARMSNSVIPRLFGEACVPPQSIVYPHADLVRELKLRTKHDVDGNVAIMTENVVDAPVAGECVSFEIKPKCGLVEREQFPSRYQMLQRIKLKRCDITRISRYDPVDLFSGKKRRVSKALHALVENPQNNLKVFINGEAAAPKEGFKLVPFDELSELVMSSNVFRQIASAQCWAGGSCAGTAHKLLEELQRRKKILSVNTDELIGAIIPNTGDESAMRRSERDGEKLVKQNKRHLRNSGSSAQEMERNTENYLRRFLLGRTAMDCSVVMTFLKSESDADADTLRKARFVKRQNYWVRVSVVDTELKPISRIPLYATQLDEYVAEYLKTTP
eukprot:GEMP01033538.1.p1 GENE.GEMP01033538.1~~GEMP01033538.1.p1  ORF type:complete len:406 (+),score=86.63 GEMP01033538.1:67-1284(+)